MFPPTAPNPSVALAASQQQAIPGFSKIVRKLSDARHFESRLYPMEAVAPNPDDGCKQDIDGIRCANATQLPMVAWPQRGGRYRIALKIQD
jgi:hypothetical protein